MKVNVVLYSDDAVERVKQRIYASVEKDDNARLYDNIIWVNNMYIEFVGRMLIINIFRKRKEREWTIEKYLQNILCEEEASVNYDNRSEYSKNYSNRPRLIINYI